MEKYLVQRRATEQACQLLQGELRGKYFKGIIFIQSGAAEIAKLMASKLAISEDRVIGIRIQRYSKNQQTQEPQIVGEAPPLENGGQGWLILDDILGEGKTLLKALEIYPNAECAVAYSWPSGATLRRPGGGSLLSAVGARMSEPAWLIFDWEREDWHQGIHDDLPFYQLEPQESLRQLWHRLRHPAAQAQLVRG
ncbi:MAG: phosphoribosyltransferase family protein [Dongiaceae bacterium]